MKVDETKLDERLRKHGYQLEKITHFKNHDRVTFGNKEVKISLNLRSKLSEIALDTLIEACVGSDSLKGEG